MSDDAPFLCRARQYSDEMVCHECRLSWDVNDREPPACNRAVPVTGKTETVYYDRKGRRTPLHAKLSIA